MFLDSARSESGFFLKGDDLERNSLINSKTLKNQPLLRSGLLFSGARNTYEGDKLDGEENGILYALEASELDLSTTQLVVLSACETANGENKNGEGVYGLQRANLTIELCLSFICNCLFITLRF